MDQKLKQDLRIGPNIRKYRLQSRNKNSMITLMEVDTECRAWYIKADDIVLTKDSSSFKAQPQAKKEPTQDK